MVHYRLVGTGVTDGNGVAHMTKDATGSTVSGYTGVGAGKIDFVCSVEDPDHISSSVQSTPYTIDDSIWYDTDGSKFTTSNVTVQNSANGVVITASANWGDLLVPNSNYISSIPIRIEFEMVSIYRVRFMLKTGSNNYKELNATGKYVINVTSQGATVYKDNTNIGTITLPDTMDIRFRFVNSGESITMKNFRIYKE